MKKFCIIIILSILLNSLNAQIKKTVIFLYENATKLTVDSIIKAGQLKITDTTYEITKFTYIISGYSCENDKPRFGILNGNIFSKQMISDIKEARGHGKSILFIQDIYLKNILLKNTKSFKTEYSLKIEF